MKPTYEDIVKYHSQKTKLLVNIECFALPMEIQIKSVIDDGAVFQFTQKDSWMSSGQWVKTEQVEVLHVFPPAELLRRIEELKNPITTMKDVQVVLDKIENKNVLTSKMLDQIAKDLVLIEGSSPRKVKKCKKKKTCK